MSEIILGRTGIKTNKNGFGALPIQRISFEDAGRLLLKALEHGITFFDTARAYSDSEEKIGRVLAKHRNDLFIATKTMAKNTDDFWRELETSLRNLKTDYVDIYQFHTPDFCPMPDDGTGLYEAMEQAREQGKIRYIGLTNHKLAVARQAVESGLYDTLQFPLSYLSSQEDLELALLCREKNIGFISMKALGGGLITNSAAAYAWQDQYDHVLPIWGIQREEELDEFLSYIDTPPILDEALRQVIKQDCTELAGAFCRGCGYCMPCPAEIQINNCARMSQLIRRSPSSNWLNENGQAMMKKVEDCIECGNCRKKCPYGLDTPALLKQHYKDYQEILAGKPA